MPDSIGAGVVVVGLAAGVVSAGQLRVPEQFATIQEAIAASVDGDDIVVAPGVYRETINFDRRAVRIRGNQAAGATVIDGDGTYGYVVRVPAGTRGASLENITITGAIGQTDESIEYGGGVFIDRAYEILLRDVIVTGNSGQYGAGVYCKGGSVTIENCEIWGNTGSYGGGLAIQLSDVEVRWSQIRENTALHGGGGVWISGGSLSLEDCVLSGNLVTGNGAGLLARGCSLNMTRCQVTGNGSVPECPTDCFFDTLRGGGAYLDAVSSGRVVDSRLSFNAAAAGGGLCFINGGVIEVVNSTIVDNSAGSEGAAVFAEFCSPRFVNCTMVGNFPGGVFSTAGSSPQITNCILSENQATPLDATEVYGTGETYVAYSLVNGNVLNGAVIGPGVVFGPPRLDGALRPKAGSPVIDSASNPAVPADITSDLAGRARFINDPDSPDVGEGEVPIVDMGAFEYSLDDFCGADFDGDGFITGEDHTRFVYAFERGSERADFDGDGFVTGSDFDLFAWAFIEGC